MGQFWGVRGALGASRNSVGCRGVRGPFWRCQGVSECVGGVRGVLGAGMDSRYSGARWGIGGIRGIQGS